MSALLVISFRDQYRACEVFNELRRREWDWVNDLDHAVMVRVDESSRMRILFSVDPASNRGPAWARAWGSFLRLVVPHLAADGLVAAAEEMVNEPPCNARNLQADIVWWREKIQLPEQFVRDVGALISPGNSSLLVLLRTSELAPVLNRLRDYSSTILHVQLSEYQDEQLNALLTQRPHQKVTG